MASQAPSDVAQVERPGLLAEVRLEAGDGDVARVSGAVDDGRIGNSDGDRSERLVVLGLLVADPPGGSDGPWDGREVPICDRPDRRRHCRAVATSHLVEDSREPDLVDGVGGDGELAGSMDVGMPREDLLGQRGARPRHADHQNRPRVGAATMQPLPRFGRCAGDDGPRDAFVGIDVRGNGPMMQLGGLEEMLEGSIVLAETVADSGDGEVQVASLVFGPAGEVRLDGIDIGESWIVRAERLDEREGEPRVGVSGAQLQHALEACDGLFDAAEHRENPTLLVVPGGRLGIDFGDPTPQSLRIVESADSPGELRERRKDSEIVRSRLGQTLEPIE